MRGDNDVPTNNRDLTTTKGEEMGMIVGKRILQKPI